MYGLDPICKELDVNVPKRRLEEVMLKKGMRTTDPGTTSYSEPAKGAARGGNDGQAVARASARRLVGASWPCRGEPIRLERAAPICVSFILTSTANLLAATMEAENAKARSYVSTVCSAFAASRRQWPPSIARDTPSSVLDEDAVSGCIEEGWTAAEQSRRPD
jgi:hypothetical protein